MCTVCYNVMFTCTLARSHPEGRKTLGETWAAVVKAINSILWTSVATRRIPARMGAEPSQYTPRRGPWRTYSRGASRRPMFKYVHFLVYIYCSVMQITALLLHTHTHEFILESGTVANRYIYTMHSVLNLNIWNCMHYGTVILKQF